MSTVTSKSRLKGLIGLSIAMLSTHSFAHTKDALIERGGYLIQGFGCADCHTPLKMGPNGPAPDFSRGLSGHPQQLTVGPAPAASGAWVWGGAGTNTAFWGPWGISYAANLTPDPETGLGSWRPEQFVAALRKGQHAGMGRSLLPPMPWQSVGRLTDADLKAMFAYLMSRPPVKNQVPAPVINTH